MLILSRRILLHSTAMFVSTWDQTPQGSQLLTELTIDDAVYVICSFTPRMFREAVRDTGHLLYRGEPINRIGMLRQEPDLLLPSTYNDQSALEYFQCLENHLVKTGIVARPSVSHIATSCLVDAIPWGTPVSIWPLGNQLSYVWPRYRNTIYALHVDRNFFDLEVDKNIQTALQRNTEIMFHSFFSDITSEMDKRLTASSFLTIPLAYENDIRSRLWKVGYAL